MFKILLLIISTTIVVLMGLDLGLFNKEDKKITKTESKDIVENEKEEPKKETKESSEESLISKKVTPLKESSIEDNSIKKTSTIIKIDKSKEDNETETLKLYAKAQFHKANNTERDEAIEIYDEIINKLSTSSDVELLKFYALAQFNKAYLSSGEESIEIFNQIIERFKDENDKELLKEFYKAQISKAYVLEGYMQQGDEAIEVYDAIIKKFSSYDEKEYKDIVDNALFSKSFLLMGERDEEAMEIYDNIINKHETTNTLPLPLKAEYAIINNIELSLITNNDDSRYRELANKYLRDSRDTKPQLDMLEILKEAQVSNQDDAINAWQEENKDYQFSNWSFTELQQWNNQMEDGEIKTRIKTYLNEFAKHNSDNVNSYEHTR